MIFILSNSAWRSRQIAHEAGVKVFRAVEREEQIMGFRGPENILWIGPDMTTTKRAEEMALVARAQEFTVKWL